MSAAKTGSHQGSDEEDVKAGGIKLFTSLEACQAHNMALTVAMAVKFGYDTSQHQTTGAVLCGKHGTAELVEVFHDGTWQYRDNSDDEHEVTHSGRNSQDLGWFLDQSPEERLAEAEG